MKQKEFISKSIEETQEFAKKFAGRLKPGDIVALYGGLGAGKTAFVQGLAKGLGYGERVFSPTFIFVRPYKLNSKGKGQRAKINTLYHIDLYRIEKPVELKSVGIEEFLSDKKAASVIEWPERIGNLPPGKTIKIKIGAVSETERKITWSE
ncbi:MAG: tRNA (adenosine(37)-N6)-threonylcarbamoyltransferase complex ATPase subunit type 1 TsaE [Candidatus Woykebacteria bacterium]